MRGYYAGKLAGDRLRQCYDLAHPRLEQYLEAEIRHVQEQLDPDDAVLELGCGYGRVAVRLAETAHRVVGIDNAPENVALARRLYGANPRCEFLEMDAMAMSFEGRRFDEVVCVQNGICAFGVDKGELLRSALAVTRPGGRLLFSTYAEGFWDDRLEWFEAQAAAGLLGEIDRERTRPGLIVCRDGFRSGLVTPGEFTALCAGLGLQADLTEVDGSSLFCRIEVPEGG